MSLEAYLKERLFKPMGITAVDWDRDPAGNVMPYGGLWLLPDLARIGQLMGDSGRWNGKQLVPASWTRAATAPARDNLSYYGLLWWLYPAPLAQDSAVHPPKSAASAPPAGRAWRRRLARAVSGGISPVATSGSTDARGGGRNDEAENRKYGFQSFQKLVLALVQKPADQQSGKYNIEVH